MNWRIVPWNPKYKLSDTGRMMGPMGLCKPWIGSGLPRAAKYTLSGTGAITVQRAMLKVWDISLEPTREWLVAVCADVRADKEERRAAARRAEKERRQAGAPKPTPVAVPSVEEWRALPQDARYELSNHGRLRGPKGLRKPCVPGGKNPYSALYPVRLKNENRITALIIRAAMLQVWGVELVPTGELIARFRAEAEAEKKLKCRPKLRLVEPKKKDTAANRNVRHCADCGRALSPGYWRRCPECCTAVRKGLDMPLEEYGTASRR